MTPSDPKPCTSDPAKPQHARRSETVATPEGDNEFAPDQPLEPIDHGHQKPPAIDTNKL